MKKGGSVCVLLILLTESKMEREQMQTHCSANVNITQEKDRGSAVIGLFQSNLNQAYGLMSSNKINHISACIDVQDIFNFNTLFNVCVCLKKVSSHTS